VYLWMWMQCRSWLQYAPTFAFREANSLLYRNRRAGQARTQNDPLARSEDGRPSGVRRKCIDECMRCPSEQLSAPNPVTACGGMGGTKGDGLLFWCRPLDCQAICLRRTPPARPASRFRAPTIAGYMWLIFAWLVVDPQLPLAMHSSGIAHALAELSATTGTVAMAAAVSVVAYLIGAISTVATDWFERRAARSDRPVEVTALRG
jgi:hypothetical protein